MYPSSFLFIAITALASFVAATPPACLLAAVLEQPNPADVKALCGTLEPQMASNITASCSGNALASAVADYSSTCLVNGVTVSIATTSSPTGSHTGSSAATATAAVTNGAAGPASSGTSTGTAATTSATGKSGAAISSAPSAGFWISIILASIFAGQCVL